MSTDLWLAAGVRTPFVRVDGPFENKDALAIVSIGADGGQGTVALLPH